MRTKKTHCIHGHAMTPENVRYDAKNGYNVCLQCQRDRHVRFYTPHTIEHKPQRSAIDRFMEKVSMESGKCWLWNGYTDEGGYGVFWNGKPIRAHIWSYQFFCGDIPQGLVLDHLCRTRNCVNPTHLEPVTERENILRGYGAPAINARKTHCPRGHEFTSENTYVYPHDGSRACRTCWKRIKER